MNPYVKSRLLVPALLIVLAACGRNTTAPLPALQRTAQSGSPEAASRSLGLRNGIEVVASPAPPFSGAPAMLHRDSTRALNLDPLSREAPPHWPFERSGSQLRSPDAIVNQYDTGGQSGITIPGGNGYTGIYANNTAYQPAQISLQPGNDPNNPFNTLYAPTTKGSDGSCLENGTDYWRYMGNSVAAAFRVYTFCNTPGFVVSKSINSTFTKAYVRYFGNGASPQYTTEIALLSDGLWHALIFNYTTNAYEDLYSTSGSNNYNLGGGWSIFETHYATGPCSSPPPIVSLNIEVQSATGLWAPISPANSDSTYNFGTCFDPTQGAPYSSKVVGGNGSLWDVTSVTAPLTPYEATIRASAPVAYYRLDDSGPSAVDSSGFGLTGTYGTGVAHPSTGLLATETTDAAALFAGGTNVSASLVTVPTSSLLQPATGVSLEAWVQQSLPNPGQTNDLVAYGSSLTGLSYTLQVLGNGTIGGFVTTASGYGLVLGKTVIRPGRVYLVDMVYTGSTIAVYIDGRLDASAPATGTIAYFSSVVPNGLALGAAFGTNRPVFSGTLDEVAVYPAALSAAAIGAHWTEGSGNAVAPATPAYVGTVRSDSPVAFYRLSDAKGLAVDLAPEPVNATYGADVARDVAGILPADVTNNAAGFPGGASRPATSITTKREAKFEMAQTVTVETWVDVTKSSSGTIDLVSYGPEGLGQPYTLQLLPNGTICFFTTTTSGYGLVAGGTALTLNVPHLLDATYDGTTMQVYVDGRLDGSAAATGALKYAAEKPQWGLSIGTAYDTYRQTFSGVLSDVAIYGSALTPARIAAHWSAGSGNPGGP